MRKGLCSIALMASILSVSLLEGRNIGLTKELENLRECVVCSIEKPMEETKNMETEVTAENITLGYTDAFWVEEDETVYLLATYACEVLEIKRGEIRKIPLAEAVLPADIITFGENIYVYDDILLELQVYTKQGEFLLQSKIELQDDYVKQLILTEAGAAILTYGDRVISVNQETGEQVTTEYTAVPVVASGEYDYAEYIATDAEGTVYSVSTKLVDGCSVISGEMTLRAVSAEGECLGSYILPIEEYTYLPERYICVLQNGNIYLLIPTKQSVDVRKVSLKNDMESKLLEVTENAKIREAEYIAAQKVSNAKIVLSREEVWQRAQEMAEYQWTLKPSHTLYWYWDYNVELPREIKAIREEHEGESSWSVQVTGIPYCWGGYHCLDWGDKGRTFQQALNANFIAGNINTTGYYKYWSAGLDCSGYVGDALGFTDKQSTKDLAALGSQKKNITNLEMMDILVYPGDHVIFFCDWLDDGIMLVGEAAVREGKVVIHPRRLNEFVVYGKYQMRTPW